MLQLDGVGKRFGRDWVVRDVELSLERGERVGLVGPNGSGKTTLLDLASGLARPSEGLVRLDGEPVPDDLVDLKARVGYVRHETGLYDRLTVDENLRFTARLHGVRDGARRAETLADRLGLAMRRHDRVGELSHGLGRRAALAFALVPDPDVLLLDEPLAGLDPDAAERWLDLLAELDDGSRLVVSTGHAVGQVPGARRVVVLGDGRVRYDGDPKGAPETVAGIPGGRR